MIYELRKKFILVSAASVFLVFTVIYGSIVAASRIQLNHTMDTLADAIAANGGSFPSFASIRPLPGNRPSNMEVITEETPFSTRFFTVWLDRNQHILRVNTDAIVSITEAQAQGYTEAALEKSVSKGWVDDFRYQIFEVENGTAIVFVNGTMNRMLVNRFLLAAFVVLSGSGLVILGLFILISKRVVRPAAESYEKQKQFVTDASHELKTPLTLILSNIDIVESEVGKSEWLEDIRGEGERMRLLISQLITLSRMDELPKAVHTERFSLSAAVEDTLSEFRPLLEAQEKTLSAAVKPDVFCKGSEADIRRLVSILLDNAVKYCDAGGAISLSLFQRHHLVLEVENSCREVDRIELEKLFDRFYRGDKARTFHGSFGIGLSIARSITQNHRGKISAYKKEGIIGFRVELRP